MSEEKPQVEESEGQVTSASPQLPKEKLSTNIPCTPSIKKKINKLYFDNKYSMGFKRECEVLEKLLTIAEKHPEEFR